MRATCGGPLLLALRNLGCKRAGGASLAEAHELGCQMLHSGANAHVRTLWGGTGSGVPRLRVAGPEPE